LKAMKSVYYDSLYRVHVNMTVKADTSQWLKCKIRGGETLHSGLGP